MLSRPGRYEKVRDNLEVKEVRVSDRRYVVCYNPPKAERQMKHREEVLKELKEELRGLKSGELRVSQTAIREREKRDGLWVIHTIDEELSAEGLALAYKQLVRQVFSSKNSGMTLVLLFCFTNAHSSRFVVLMCFWCPAVNTMR